MRARAMWKEEKEKFEKKVKTKRATVGGEMKKQNGGLSTPFHSSATFFFLPALYSTKVYVQYTLLGPQELS